MQLNHLAIIMDGNRRWAKDNFLGTNYGHKAGAKTLMKLCKIIRDQYHISIVTVYAFSTENTTRCDGELKNLFQLLDEYLASDIVKLQQERINVRIIGDFSIFAPATQKRINDINMCNITNYVFTLNIALNYGGRREICNAFNIMRELNIKHVTEAEIAQYLYEPRMQDVDLMIRTGGSQRLSNFLIWQSVYAELYFTEVLWPDFTEQDLKNAILFYERQRRNFGG